MRRERAEIQETNQSQATVVVVDVMVHSHLLQANRQPGSPAEMNDEEMRERRQDERCVDECALSLSLQSHPIT